MNFKAIALAKVYIDTSVVIALANPKDDFHDESSRFMGGLQELGSGSTIGPPVLLEIGKAAQRRGVKAASTVLQVIDKYNIELANLDTSRLLNLVDRYITYRVARAKYRLDLMHYASATLLSCSHLASWDKGHFNEHIEKRVNKVNSLSGLTTLKVGDPPYIARSLGFG